jgi:hypothetical protein
MAVTTSGLKMEANDAVASEFPAVPHRTSVVEAKKNITVRGFGSSDQSDADMARPPVTPAESLYKERHTKR